MASLRQIHSVMIPRFLFDFIDPSTQSRQKPDVGFKIMEPLFVIWATVSDCLLR